MRAHGWPQSGLAALLPRKGRLLRDVVAALTIDLLLFAAVIVAFMQLSRWTTRLRALHRQALIGAVLGAAAMLAMTMPVEVAPGRYGDARGVLVALSGPFGGLPALVVTAAMTGGYRIWLGGAGMQQGLLSIALLGLAGLAVSLMAARRQRAVTFTDLVLLASLAMVISLVLRFAVGNVGTSFAAVGLPLLLTLGVGIPLLGAMLIQERSRNELMETLAESERRFKGIADNLPGSVFRRVLTKSGQLRYDYLSPGFATLYGLSQEQVRDDPGVFLQIMDHPNREEFIQSLHESARTLSPWLIDMRIRHPSGQQRWIRSRATPRRVSNGDVVWDGVSLDVTDQKAAQEELTGANLQLQQEITRRTAIEAARDGLIEELRRLSDTDPLTSVLNRRGFFSVAQRELKRVRRTEQPMSVLVLDLDHFKLVNDRHGHEAGDIVLRETAATCQRIIREVDVVARFGGEVFVMLLQDADAVAARQVAERIRVGIERATMQAGAMSIRVTASIGVAALAATDRNIDDLLRRADEALYRAKGDGRNRVVVANPSALPSRPDALPADGSDAVRRAREA